MSMPMVCSVKVKWSKLQIYHLVVLGPVTGDVVGLLLSMVGCSMSQQHADVCQGTDLL